MGVTRRCGWSVLRFLFGGWPGRVRVQRGRTQGAVKLAGGPGGVAAHEPHATVHMIEEETQA
jgi:hypothetical protein